MMRKSARRSTPMLCCYPTIDHADAPPRQPRTDPRARIASTSAPTAPRITIEIATGPRGAARRRCSTRRGVAGAARSSCRARPSGGCTATRSRGARRRRADPRSRRRALQAPRDGRPHLRRARSAPAPIAAAAIVAVGGGVIGDIAGFAAATYLRGIPLVQVPTTLLAQVDSAIGGKVGVNHALGKNLIGAFHQPAAGGRRSGPARDAAAARVPRRAVRGGQVRRDRRAALFDRVAATRRRRSSRATRRCSLPVIAESLPHQGATSSSRTSASRGLRRILNFGHTVGHALEAVTKYRRFRHGEAVAYGMLAAAELGRRARRARRRRSRGARRAHRAARAAAAGRRPVGRGRCVEATRRDKKVVAGPPALRAADRRSARRRRSTTCTEEELTQALLTIGSGLTRRCDSRRPTPASSPCAVTRARAPSASRAASCS